MIFKCNNNMKFIFLILISIIGLKCVVVDTKQDHISSWSKIHNNLANVTFFGLPVQNQIPQFSLNKQLKTVSIKFQFKQKLIFPLKFSFQEDNSNWRSNYQPPRPETEILVVLRGDVTDGRQLSLLTTSWIWTLI